MPPAVILDKNHSRGGNAPNRNSWQKNIAEECLLGLYNIYNINNTIFNSNTINYSKNNNIYNTNNTIFYINSFNYNKNNIIYNMNNIIFNINTISYNNIYNTNNTIFLY